MRGDKDAQGESLEEFLVKRSNHPSIGFWALPGGFINLEENLDDTARRGLEEETHVKGITMEQIAVDHGAIVVQALEILRSRL